MIGGTLYGESNINISGSPIITGAIYGAGRGYNYSSKPELAGCRGETNINIEGTPTLSGTIYGAGAGISGRADMAKLIGESNINLTGSTSVDIYRSDGNIAAVDGITNINILNGTHTGRIFGRW